MSELINNFSNDPIVQDFGFALIFFVVFVVARFLTDQVHAPYHNFEDGVFTVYLYVPARNGSRYHEYRFVLKEDGRLIYVSDRILPKCFLIGAVALFVIYLFLSIFKVPILILYVHGGFLLCLLLSTILLLHPLSARIYLKKQGV